MSQLRVGIVGATGYLGTELLRHLLAHPQAKVVKLASASKAGKPAASSFPTFGHLVPQTFTGMAPADLADLDLVFTATPSGVARDLAPLLLAQGVKVVDLSGDHRLSDGAAAKHYGAAPVAKGAVYGLPEINAARIAAAKLVANPGCYPTASALALLPLVQQGLVEPHVIVDAVSGISGAGKEPSEAHHFPEQNESAFAYKVGTHRHQPEIAETLGVPVVFTPHVVPMNRGILATAYATAKGPALSAAELAERYHKAYAGEPFAKVVDFEPDTKHVRNTNYCHVKPHVNGNVYVVTSAIDNLVKGGAGQAIENMNLMSGFERALGLPVLGGGP
ncbi:MAG: N-acetyl-gamma-glutamyl-phosphate reductase [Thermoplasmata archaeon]|jgi:N-acetyl-gamma-glutamyl-phosphate reductase|nr:N-acetyl-gamma-glutamyl-phosphate reductase [Thermoplasmata archaeon]